MRKIILLGSTGSIGTQTLKIIKKFPREFKIIGLACGSNEKLFVRQVREFKPKFTLIAAREKNPREKMMKLAATPRLRGAAAHEADLIVNAISGPEGFWPTLAAVRAGKKIALANKESLVMGGEILTKLARKTGAQILPIDSEASAVWQLLGDFDGAKKDIKRVILTASGGPFWRFSRAKLRKVTPAQALNHPTWKMGKKLTIDSATLVNKGFEIIEAHWLFGIPPEKIDVLIHREGLVHALVEYKDGRVVAHVSAKPDMKEFIAHALFYPKPPPEEFARGSSAVTFKRRRGILKSSSKFKFQKPDFSVLKGPVLARKVLKKGGTAPAVFCMANEIAVQKFLDGKTPFLGIYKIIENYVRFNRLK